MHRFLSMTLMCGRIVKQRMDCPSLFLLEAYPDNKCFHPHQKSCSEIRTEGSKLTAAAVVAAVFTHDRWWWSRCPTLLKVLQHFETRLNFHFWGCQKRNKQKWIPKFIGMSILRKNPSNRNKIPADQTAYKTCKRVLSKEEPEGNRWCPFKGWTGRATHICSPFFLSQCPEGAPPAAGGYWQHVLPHKL